MKYAILNFFLLAGSMISCVPYHSNQKCLKYNYYENKWEIAEPSETLKYNPYQDKWEYAR